MQSQPCPQYTQYHSSQLKRLKLRQSMQTAIKGYATIDDILSTKISKVNSINKFTSKLKTENRNIEQLIQEMETLNISKFLDEVVTIIVTTLKLGEVRSLAELACKIGTQYETFPKSLIKQLKKQIESSLAGEDRSQLVALFYMLIQLFVYGFPLVQNDIPELIKKVFKSGLSVKEGVQMDQGKKEKNYGFNIDFYWILVKEFGEVFCGLSGKKLETWGKEGREIVRFPEMITVQIKKSIASFLEKYVKEVSGVLEDSLKNIVKIQGDLRTELKMDGNYNPETEKTYKETVDRYTKTRQKLIEIGQYISLPVTYQGISDKILDLQEISKLQHSFSNGDIFEDQYQKQLYLQLPPIEDENPKTEDPQKLYPDFKLKLDTCKNIQDADNLIKLFLPINSKKNRKMLCKDLLEYRRQYHLVTPFLCRIAATLGKKWKDIEENINEMILNENEKLRESTVTNYVMTDRRTRNHKYICELTKFGIIDINKTMGCIKILIDNLIGTNIDLLLLCLQSVGRFLYMTKESTSKFVFLLNQLNNVIKKKPLPAMIESQITNCIALLKPIEPIPLKQKPPKSETELLFQKLLQQVSKQNMEETTLSISTLLAASPDNHQLFIKRFLKSIPKHDFIENYFLAVILDKLDNQQLFKRIKGIVKKRIFELIDREESQLAVSWARFFGEIFNYQIITKDEFYEYLRELLSLKQNSITVINVVCTILGSCIDCLNVKKTASINQKLNFLLDFKVFINTRKYIPMFTEFQILDLFERTQPEIIAIQPEEIHSFKSAMKLKQQGRQKELNELKELQNINMYKKKPAYKERTEEEDYNRQDKPTTEQEKTQQQQQPKPKTIDEDYDNYLKEEIEKSMGRIAKPKIAEFAGVKKKKVGEKSVIILGKSGNKVVKREVHVKL